MTDDPNTPKPRPGLNPALRSRQETTHNTEVPSRVPAETASVQREEGRTWPLIWAVVTIGCALLLLWLVFW